MVVVVGTVMTYLASAELLTLKVICCSPSASAMAASCVAEPVALEGSRKDAGGICDRGAERSRDGRSVGLLDLERAIGSDAIVVSEDEIFLWVSEDVDQRDLQAMVFTERHRRSSA